MPTNPHWKYGGMITAVLLGLFVFLASSLSTAAVPATPNSWQWQAAADLNQQRYAHTAHRLPDGRVVVIGGISDVNNATRLNSAEVYDPTANSWTLYTNGSSQFRNQHTSTLLNDGRILVIGGDANFGGVVNSAEIFDPIAGTWTAVTSPGPMAQHTAVLLNDGSVLVFGGYSGYTGGSPDYILHAMRYHVATDSWDFAGQNDLYEATGERLGDGRVLAMARGLGGFKLYNPANDSWTIVNAPPINWGSYWGVSLTRYNGSIYFAGYGEGVTYDALSGWGGVDNLPVNRSQHAATAVNDGVMLVSGIDPDYNRLTSVELNGDVVGQLQTGRTSHTATTLNDGRVLVVGGIAAGSTVLSSSEIGESTGSATATPTNSPTATLTPTPTATPTLTPTPTTPPPTGGIIRGRVWLDDGWLLASQGAYGPNVWGIQEAGEPGIGGVTVILDTPGADGDWNTPGDNISYQQITNASGEYVFTNLFISKANGDPMPYAVQFEPAEGYRFVDANVGNDDQIDSDAENETQVAIDRWVAGLETFLSPTTPAQNHVDAGLFRNSVSGRVWLDANSNGIQDPDETGIGNLGVGLVRGDVAGGAPVTTATTDSDGRFTFTHIRPENHLLIVRLLNHAPSPANQGDNDELDSDGTPSDCQTAPHCPIVIPIRPASNQIVTAQDFGFIPQGKITTQVAQVTLTNGIEQMQPHAGITLTLLGGYPSMPMTPLGTKTSDSSGIVQFTQLNSRSYQQLGQWPNGFLMYPSDFYPDGNAQMAQTTTRVIDLNSSDQRLVELELRFYFYQPEASSTATPSGGGSVSTGGNLRLATAVTADPITLSLPPGAITETITLHLTQVAVNTSYLPGVNGYLPTGFGALWDVTVGDVQRYGYALQAPATLTLPFDPASLLWREAADLHLLWWNVMAGQWETPSTACGASAPEINMTTGWLTAELCQSGQYGLFQTGWQTFLPIVD